MRRHLTFLALTLASLVGCSKEPGTSVTPLAAGTGTPSPATSGTTAQPPMNATGSAGMLPGGAGVSGNVSRTSTAGSAASGRSGSAGTTAGTTGAAQTSPAGTGGMIAAAGTGGAPLPAAGASGGGSTMMPAAGTGSTAGQCVKGTVKAAEVVFIGESFIAASGAIPRYTTQLARQAGTIGMSDSYRSYAVSGTQLTTGDIPGQFTRAMREGPVKVVLMDGGGNDLLVGNRCKGGFDAPCKQVVTTVQTLFAQMQKDGVKDVVYFFYPDPMGIGAQIKAAMDILRPEMKKACDGASDVRCVWVDQRETWNGNYDKYTSDGIHPTDAGSMASAKQIWEAMLTNCIAQ